MPQATRLYVVVCIFEGGGGFSIRCHSAGEEGVPVLSKPLKFRGRRIGSLRAERKTLPSAELT